MAYRRFSSVMDWASAWVRIDGLTGVPDVVLSHTVEEPPGLFYKTKQARFLFVRAVDPTGVQDADDRAFGMRLWGAPNQVALATLRVVGRTRLIAHDIRVLGTYQRQGLAKRMYQYAQRVTGRRVEPSSDQSDYGRQLWRSIRREKALGEELEG